MRRRGSVRAACLFMLVVFWPDRTIAGQENDGAVSLWRNGGSSLYYTSGIVEVLHTGLIGNICHGGTWGQTEADTVCKQLSYSGAARFGTAGDGAEFGTDEGITLLNKVNCSSDAVSIWQCSFVSGAIADLSCTDQSDVFVECYTQRLWEAAPYQSMVRLQDGMYVTYGRVEVYCNDQWRTICKSAFGWAEANTVCIQLGYARALEHNHLYLPSSSDTNTSKWLSGYNCSQTNVCIANCGSCSREASTPCTTDQATVKCFFDAYSSLPVESCQYADTEECEDCSSNLATIIGSVAASFAVLVLFVLIPLIIWCCVACHPHIHEEDPKTKVTSLTDGSESDIHVSSAHQKALRLDMTSHVNGTLPPPPYTSSFQASYNQHPVLTQSPPPAYY